ncbi:ATP-binding protein [Geitlerinema calcuttense]|uniref:histidine kinase n=1 Tax=Geitlerinema calcuttense NRMC-F 0142 TaxID=2922238 RepID=A0ABT7LZ99_9CYAN|nr:ATP-binding protein [Geitlerinema calcuttense]MDL5057341.1 ATP-binding protein [Geitlerinema calcuttense NRMC-F 0142]
MPSRQPSPSFPSVTEDNLLTLLWETASIALCITDEQGNLVSVNAAYLKLYGGLASEVLGQHFTTVLLGVGESQQSQSYEGQMQCKNGEVRDLQVTIAPLHSEKRSLKLMTLVDITECKRLKCALQHSEQRLEKLAAHVPGTLYQFCLSREGKFYFPYISLGIAEIAELDAATVIADAQSLLSLVHPDDWAELEESIVLSAQTLHPWKWEGRCITPSGKVKWVQGASRPELQADGSIVWDGWLMEITDRKQTNAALLERSRLATLCAKVGAILGQGGNLETILQECTRTLVVYLNAKGVKIWTFSSPTQPPQLQAAIGELAGECPAIGSEGMLASEFPAYPLIVDERLIGVLGIAEQEGFTDAVHHTLSWIANAIAVAIDRWWAREALLSRREGLLFRLASQIRNSLDLNTILNTAVQEIRSLLKIDRCHFLWCWPDLRSPTLTITHEASDANFPCWLGDYHLPNLEQMVERIQNLESWQIDDLSVFKNCSPQEACEVGLLSQGITAQLLLPLQTRSGQLGAIACIHFSGPRPWSDREVDLLQAVTNQLTLAIEQAELYALTRTDALRAQAQAQELKQALHKLQQTQAQLVQTEKMSSLGQMVAGIAHEINNPVNFINGNLLHASNYIEDLSELLTLYMQAYPNPASEITVKAQSIDLEFIQEDLPRILDSMRVGAERISQIVLSLRKFSRLDEAERKHVNLNEGIDNTLSILQHRLTSKTSPFAIQVIKKYSDLPAVECYAGQLNQVFMNILSNAIDALEEAYRQDYFRSDTTPTIWIYTQPISSHPNPDIEMPLDTVLIRIADNGIGIPDSIKKRLFDPFFTTKSVGKGTGLGLSISYQVVVERHGGSLECFSEPGQGAEFFIKIPISPIPVLPLE